MIDNDKQQAHILIVDDEESIRMTFEIFLARAGYRNVSTATNISEALAAVEKQKPDLVISDIVLVGESGTELLSRLREMDINCPVVMVTGFPNLESAAKAVRLGAFDYIPKPVNKETLLHFTRQALNHRWLQKEKERLITENEQYRKYLEAVFRSVQDCIVTVDPELNIVQVNDTARQCMLAAAPEGKLPTNLYEVAGPLGKSCLEDAKKVLETRKEVREHRIECRLHDGEPKVLSLNAAPIHPNDHSFTGIVLVARDITNTPSPDRGKQRDYFHGYVGHSQAMQEVYNLIENVGRVDTTVLITGESGTGKELAAEALHAESLRRDNPLIKVDCASIPEDILESELFGHRRGAFTGAEKNRQGRILQAEGGTLFLDEIGDISPRMQLRLLRFLQERTFYPVGQDQPVQVDVRVIAATNADLREKVARGEFREDLYYRLRVIEINLPPLRARKEGIPVLANHFLKSFQEKLGHNISGISDQAMEALMHYSWPGNVRELKHVIERGCVLCTGQTLALEHLPEEIRNSEALLPLTSLENSTAGIALQHQDLLAEKNTRGPMSPEEEIMAALKQAGGNKSKAARLLGIDRSTLYRRMRRYNIGE
ncbi:sigma 54-interacting transcriptional regulator [Desulfolithobacter sp.]